MPYLDAVTGPAMGRRYTLDLPQYVLGRHPDCNIVLESGSVSRQHAKLIKSGPSFLLEDLNSRNGTFINGKLIGEATKLVDGDSIRICDIELTYHDDGSLSEIRFGASDGSSLGIMMVDDRDGEPVMRSVTAKLDVRGSQFGVQVNASAESKLSAVLEIMKNLGKAIGLDAVLPKVLDSLFAIFLQADRGFIILKDDQGQLTPRWVKTRRPDQEEMVRVSRTVLREVMQTGEAIMSLDAGSDERFEMSQSIADFRIRSMIVAPLLNSEGEPIGAIQIDTIQHKGGFESKDLEILVGVANQAGIAIENAQLHEQVVAQKLVEQDLELARQVQLAFLPKESPKIPGYSFFQSYEPAAQIGGDYFDYIQLAPDRWAIVLADVVGHGVAAAMFMAKLSAETRFAFAAIEDPCAAMASLNDRITNLGAERFVTMVVIILDASQHKAKILIAGHMPPIRLDQHQKIDEPGLDVGGPPLGIMTDIPFDAIEVDIRRGESLTLYTDGIFEAPNAAGDQFSMERVRQLVQSHGKRIEACGDLIMKQVSEHIQGCDQEDDMCLVILGRDD
ncbi:SpoIIE family protein phosphatase [Pirellulaceae bacterium SH449]